MDTTQNAIQTLAEARYAGMAAKALELKQIEIFRRIDGTLDPGITEATEPGLGALGAWIRQGRDIPEDNARQAWWRVMNIYHQEEIYDISSKEIATNVRSYAYTLLAVVSEFLRCLPPDEPNKRLAIANVSGFAPKDFYNFPNGPVGGRFYHEAEFFGIYRRLLAIIAADQRVVPLRVVLADPAEGIRSHTPNSSALDSKRPIGWKLDPIWKLVLDCARIHIVPWPIVGPTVQSKAAEDFYPPERRTQWGVVFPEGRDPAKKLPYSTLRYLWAPTYADVRDLYHDYGPTDTLDQWLRHVAPYETIVESNDDVPQELKDKATRGKESGLETRIDKLRKKDQLSAFCETYLGKNNVDPANLVARLDKAWSAILKEFFYWIDLNPNLTDRIEEVIRLQSFQSIDSELRDRGVTLPSASDDDAGRYLIAVHRAYQLSQSFLQNKIDSRKTDYTDKMLVLAHTCHEIDALGKYLQIEHKRFTPAPEYSSAGVELGPAENWLHRFLIWLEASKLESEIRVNGPLPLWKLMASDLCGVASGQNKDTEKEAEEMLGKLRGRLKICTVGSDSNSTTREMEKEFIFPEFLMVGMTSADNLDADGNVVKLEKIEWCGLVGASISEPYQTCRIQLLFGKDDPRIRAHTGWLNEIWKNGDNDTQTFINKLKKEVANVPPYRQST
jgi:hypothetical protein